MTAVALLAGPAPVSAVQPPTPPGQTVTITVTTEALSAHNAAQPVASSVPCAPALGQLDRFHACWQGVLTFTFILNGEPVGTTVADLVQYIDLNPSSRDWTEYDTITAVVSTGTTAPINFGLITSCAIPCHATSHFTGTVKVGESGTVSYSDSIATGGIQVTHTHYIFEYLSPPYIPVSYGDWDSVKYRCDDNLPGIAGAGCVFPELTPTLVVSHADFGASAAMIAWAQANLSGHWGDITYGHPLTRLANSTTSGNNRKIICNRGWTAFPPWVAGSVTVKDSCDEFPFAATYQSGAMNGVTTGKTCAQVEAVKTRSSGTVAQIWNAVKPIGTFSPSAKCVRGHIPLSLNTDLGSTGYRKFIGEVRLLDEDPFWLRVAE